MVTPSLSLMPGRRHSVDVLKAFSTYHAAASLCHPREKPTDERLPIPSVATIFEVVANRRVYTVTGKALQQWIDKRRKAWKGPRGLLFSQRPTLE